jgi:hypothetical protein
MSLNPEPEKVADIVSSNRFTKCPPGGSYGNFPK